MSRIFPIIGVLLLTALLLPAADVDGAWKGSFDFSGQTVPVTIQLKAPGGGALSGTVQGLPTSDPEIQNGKIDGDTVSFSVDVQYQGTVKVLFRGKVSGDEIVFDMGTADGTWGTQFTAKRS